ncbi:MAG: PEP-utilizing enzyme [Candidatus Paceibacterota bacterium]
MNNLDNYKFFYESQGYGLFLEDLIIRDYVSWPMIVIGKGEEVKKYVPEQTINDLHSEGLLHSEKEIKDKVSSIKEIVLKLKDFSFENISEEKFKEAINNLSKIVDLYSYFDSAYSEGIYEENPDDPRCALIEKTKNVIRNDLDYVFFRENGFVRTLLNTIADNNSINSVDINWYKVSEVENLIKDDELVSDSEISSRKNLYIFNREKDGNINFLSGEEARPILNKIKIDSNKSNSLSGTIAHGKGRVTTGNVCIIHRDYSNHQKLVNDMDKMNEGDILVTTITDPEFMPAIKKAGAIVTDIGGLLSHAAISARELDKICIVGTESATKALKNGDKVEVNADEGIVKIIEREK